MQPIELLCEIIAQKGKVAASRHSQTLWFAALLAHGFIEKASVVQSLPCMNCDHVHDAEIVHHEGRIGVLCPEKGFTDVSEGEIVAVRANLPRMIDTLADAFDCRARKSSPVTGETWRVGRVSSAAGDIAIYVHPTLTAERDATNLAAALTQEPRSTFWLILTAAGSLQVGGTTTVPLSEAVELDLPSPQVRPVTDLRDLVGVTRKNLGGAPNRYGEALSTLITKRSAEGRALDTRNAEARAVLSDFKKTHPHLRPPSLSSVQDYVSKFRAGQ